MDHAPDRASELCFEMRPIGFVRSPFKDKASAPRQAPLSQGATGSVELCAGRGLEHAVEGLQGFSHLWLVFVFDRALGSARMKVQPPRSSERRGVFATRSPHRPNPIGLSAVRLLGIEGLSLSIADLDLCDGTPVLDIKPYLPYADAISNAQSGWLESDPGPSYQVTWSERAAAARAFLLDRTGADVGTEVETLLATGPEPKPYRRIRVLESGVSELARKALRFRFVVQRERIEIVSVNSGHRAADLALPKTAEHVLHAELSEKFGR